MTINVQKLTIELEDAGIPIYGCSSDGRIDFKPSATQSQINLADIILSNHISNKQQDRFDLVRTFITTGVAPFLAIDITIPQLTAAFIEIKAIAVNASGSTRFWHTETRIKRLNGAPSFISAPTVISLVGEAGTNWMITGTFVGNNLHIDLLGENGRIDWLFDFDINKFTP